MIVRVAAKFLKHLNFAIEIFPVAGQKTFNGKVMFDTLFMLVNCWIRTRKESRVFILGDHESRDALDVCPL